MLSQTPRLAPPQNGARSLRDAMIICSAPCECTQLSSRKAWLRALSAQSSRLTRACDSEKSRTARLLARVCFWLPAGHPSLARSLETPHHVCTLSSHPGRHAPSSIPRRDGAFAHGGCRGKSPYARFPSSKGACASIARSICTIACSEDDLFACAALYSGGSLLSLA
jgi:hypothetical protein